LSGCPLDLEQRMVVGSDDWDRLDSSTQLELLSERDPSLDGEAVGICRRVGRGSMAVAPWVVSDELWGLVEPLLPRKERRFRYPGRTRLPDREVLQGVLFVLHTGISCSLKAQGGALAAVVGVRSRSHSIACG
jgi:hypothetical protein